MTPPRRGAPARPQNPARRRQIGAERQTTPLPEVAPTPSAAKIALGRVAIIVTVLAWLAYVITTVAREFLNGSDGFRFTMEAVGYVVIVTFLTISALTYLISRQGALQRFRTHRRASRAELDRHFADHLGGMTVLVPSYDEEPDVVRATLWSAALQEYPGVRVVLLLDDPPTPTDEAKRARLDATRALPDAIGRALAGPASRALQGGLRLRLTGDDELDLAHETELLASEMEGAAEWFAAMMRTEVVEDHVGTFFVEQVLDRNRSELAATAGALRGALRDGATLDRARLQELWQRLERLFTAEVTVFERKRYASLSHEPNKAMNLNAYIGLMGGAYATSEGPEGTVLHPARHDGSAELEIPDTDYVLTLDADSLLLPGYCLRLVHTLDQPGNERVAVIQTPYSAFRGAPTRIERLAGATTDLQHVLHQGSTHYGATFWVGANAIIRTTALEDIRETTEEDGLTVHRFVQDRTVIEDTESSIDLVRHGWSLHNYPERLSYSATPPDFGSLVVQRRRWANGGLLILPKFIALMRERRARGERTRLGEVLVRVNYMASLTWASLGLLFLLAYPYDSRLLSPLVLLAAAPYFLAMGFDLRDAGYRFRDIFWIYGFNLILLPVNLAGVLKSIEQAITGRKIPFARTPKVRNRTATPALFVLVPLAIVAFSVFTFARDLSAQNWGNAIYAAVNAILASLAFVAYIGIRPAIVDVALGVTDWLYVDPERGSRRGTPTRRASRPAAPTPVAPAPAEPHWRSVLFDTDPAAHAGAAAER